MSRKAPSGGLHPEIALPHAQEWELYHNGFSLCSKKVRVCLDELGLPYAGHHVDLIETGSYQNVGREFLAVNPGGTVPVLVHRGHPVYESHDQIVYAAEHAGAPGAELLPGDGETGALVAHWTDCASLVGNPIHATHERAGNCIPGLTLPLFAAMVQYIPTREILKGLLTHPYKERPLLFLLLELGGLRGMTRLRPLMRLLHRSRAHMERHLDALGEQLEKHGGPWIAGERFTLADVSWVVILDRLVEADWDALLWGGGRRPAIASYWGRLAARPSHERAIAGARCSITRRGIADVKRAKAGDAALRAALEER